MHDLYFAEIYRPGAIFLLQIVWVCLRSRFHIIERRKKIAVQGKTESYDRSNSFEVIQGDQNWYKSKARMRFAHLYSFGDITIYLLKICFFVVLLTPVLFEALAKGVSL